MNNKIATRVTCLNRYESAKLLGISQADFVMLSTNRKLPKAVRVKGKARWTERGLIEWKEDKALWEATMKWLEDEKRKRAVGG
jgi:predicted DNA-binding transcriptional regulator AlpA